MKKSTKLCIILVSACLALALLAGALLVIPKWTADDPTDTADTADTTDTTITAHTTAAETIELPTPELSTDDLSALVGTLNAGHTYYTFLNVFCDPGDTVTLTADSDCLAVLDVPFSTAMSGCGRIIVRSAALVFGGMICNLPSTNLTCFVTFNSPVSKLISSHRSPSSSPLLSPVDRSSKNIS